MFAERLFAVRSAIAASPSSEGGTETGEGEGEGEDWEMEREQERERRWERERDRVRVRKRKTNSLEGVMDSCQKMAQAKAEIWR